MTGSHDIRVPFVDLKRTVSASHDAFLAACDGVLRSGCFLNGPQLAQFEKEFAEPLLNMHAIGVGSGTQALQILLLAHGILPGDEVITTAASFYATAKAISLVGAVPVFVDVRSDDFNLDAESARSAVTRKTRAILAVHLYGRPADMQALRAVAEEAGAVLLEDAAHAHGASVDGVPAGCLGDGAAFSFYPTKNIGAFGDAGAVLVRDSDVAERARSGRFLGWDGVVRDRFSLDGISGRIDEMQAALLRVRLAGAGAELDRRRYLAQRYRAALPADLLTGPAAGGVTDANHLFVIRHDERDRIAAHLHAAGIETIVHYPIPLHRQPRYERPNQSLPEAERWARRVLSLPLHPTLTDEEQDQVIAALLPAL